MSEHIEITFDDQGRLLLPTALRRRLGLEPGMTLIVERETSGAAYLKIQEADPPLTYKDGVLVIQAQPSEDLEHFVQQERTRRTIDLSQQSDV